MQTRLIEVPQTRMQREACRIAGLLTLPSWQVGAICSPRAVNLCFLEGEAVGLDRVSCLMFPLAVPFVCFAATSACMLGGPFFPKVRRGFRGGVCEREEWEVLGARARVAMRSSGFFVALVQSLSLLCVEGHTCRPTQTARHWRLLESSSRCAGIVARRAQRTLACAGGVGGVPRHHPVGCLLYRTGEPPGAKWGTWFVEGGQGGLEGRIGENYLDGEEAFFRTADHLWIILGSSKTHRVVTSSILALVSART